jgi:DNA-binding LacI/PurR family transcriptional regulator
VTPPILGDWTAAFGHHAGQELARTGGFTAVFSSNDQMALGLIHAFRSAGRSVPGDVSIVGFDDIPEAPYLLPPLTTVSQDFPELGRRSLDLLMEQIDSGTRATAKLRLPPHLVTRVSTAPPK